MDNDNNCPISYTFSEKIEVIPETPKKKTILLIKMYTKKISDKYKNSGTNTWLDHEWINIDYGNNFTQKQKMVQEKDKLTAYFPGVEKVCTYKRYNQDDHGAPTGFACYLFKDTFSQT
ncbi:hypothetical protein LAV92_10310 [Bacillus cereus]|nr:hypothetical protein [Bacillus cereus]